MRLGWHPGETHGALKAPANDGRRRTGVNGRVLFMRTAGRPFNSLSGMGDLDEQPVKGGSRDAKRTRMALSS